MRTRPSSRASWSRWRRHRERHEPGDTANSKNLRPCRHAFPAKARSANTTVCKLIDTTTCIGCKACEVACLEWNDYAVPRNRLRQHLPDHAGDGVELLEPDQVQRARARRRHACSGSCAKTSACTAPIPAACAACPADGAIVQYPTASSISSRRTASAASTASPAARSTFPSSIRKPRRCYKCTFCSDRVGAGPRAGLHQSLPHRLPALRHQGRHEGAGRNARRTTARAHLAHQRRRLRSRGCRRHQRHLRAARHHQSRSLWRTAARIRAFRWPCASGRVR